MKISKHLIFSLFFFSTIALSPLFAQGTQDGGKKDTTITINAKNTDVREVVGEIAKKLGRSVVVHTDVKSSITAVLDKVDALEALDIICKTHKLAWILEGNTIIVYSRELLVTEGQAKVFDSETVSIKNRSVKDVFNQINITPQSGDQTKQNSGSGVSHTGGKILYDEKDNSLTIFDTKANISSIKSLIEKLDRKIKSVLIEAKIVSVELKDQQKFGINWNLLAQNRELKLPFASGSGGASVGYKTDPFSIVGVNFTFDVLIDALGQNNKVKVLSSPRVTVISGEEAKFIVGQQISYKTVTYGPQNATPIQDFKFIQTGIKLNVTPTIYGESVKIKIHPEVSKPTFSAPDAPPTVDTSEADSIIYVGDGQTVTLGGLIQEDKSDLHSGIPFLSKVPILGLFFSSSELHNNSSELVVFITVKIL